MNDACKRKIAMSAKTLIIATTLLAATTALTVPAFAAGGDGTGPNGSPPAATQTLPLRATVMFNLLDTNHDAAVDKDEFAVISTATFDALDQNHDGKLTQDELGGRLGAMMGERGGRGGPGMGPGDRGGPGMGPGDRDGRGPGQGRMDDQRGPRDGMMGRMGGFFNFSGNGPQGGPPSFADLDTNHDGAISQDEFNAGMPVPGQGFGPGPRR
jgi:hypothetical protein